MSVSTPILIVSFAISARAARRHQQQRGKSGN